MFCDRYKELKRVLLENPQGCTKEQIFQAIEDYRLSLDAIHMLQRDLSKLRRLGFPINTLKKNSGGKYYIRGVPEDSPLPEY